MHTPSLFIGSLILLSSCAAAQVEQPRFYVPRQIKRQTVPNIQNQIHERAPVEEADAEKRALTGLLTGLTNGGIFPVNDAVPSGESATTSTTAPTGLLPGLGLGLPSTIAPLVPTTTAAAVVAPSTTETVAAPVPTTSSSGDLLGGLLTGILGGTSSAVPVTNTFVAPPQETTGPDSTTPLLTGNSSSIAITPTSSSSGGGLLDPILTGLLPILTTSTAPTDVPTTTTSGGLLDLTLFPGPSTTTSSVPTATTETTTTGTDSSIPTSTGTDLPTATSSSPDTVTSDSSLPTTTASASLVLSATTDPVFATTSIESNGTSIAPTATESSTLSLPTTTESASLVLPTTSSVITALPTDTTIPNNSTETSTSLSIAISTTESAALPTITSAAPTTSVAEVSSTIAELPITSTTAAPTVSQPETIMPIGTTSASAWIPSSIIVQPTLTLGTDSATKPTATSMPTTVPQVLVNPSNTNTKPPPDMTLVQIGFLYELNYLWVVATPLVPVQIFEFTPQGIADALKLQHDQVIVDRLIPYDTTASLGYVTTLVMVYLPNSMVSTLAQQIHQPVSALYSNPEASINQIMNYINPAIPLTPGQGLASNAAASGNVPTTDNNGNADGTGFSAEQPAQSATAKGTTAGIAVAAIGGAAAYGAAMFFLARRYKRKKLSHRRSSSTSTFGDMAQVQNPSPALMGAAVMSGGRSPVPPPFNDRDSQGSGKSNGQSARNAQISGPMMAENSLGWN